MNIMRFKKLILTFLVIISLLSVSFGTIGISTDNSNKEEPFFTRSLSKKRAESDLKIVSLDSGNEFTKTDYDLAASSDDIFHISDEAGDEYHLEMISYEDKKLVSYEHLEEGKTTIRYRSSTDFSQVFSNIEVIDYDNNLFSPCVALVPEQNHEAFGAFISTANDSTLIYEVEFNSFTNMQNPVTSEDAWSEDGFYDFKSADIVRYDDITYDNLDMQNTPYIVSVIGSTDFETAECINSPMFFFRSPEDPERFTLAWDPNINDCSNLVIDTTDINNLTYGICEIENNTNTDLLFFDDNPITNGGAWEKGGASISHQFIRCNGDLSNPKISVEGNEVYIIAETDARGEQELVLYFSPDLGETWSEPKYISQNNDPVSDFSYDATNLDVSFSDESFDIDGYIADFIWKFGDGDTSIDQNPNHLYDNPGTYQVNLTVTDDDGAVDTVSKEITVTNTNPIPDFTIDPLVPIMGVNVSFNSSVITYDDRIIEEYIWYLGDGTISLNSENVTHKYSENGTYVVNLTVVDNESGVGFVEKTVHIGFAADFTVTDKIYETGENIEFIDDSQIPSVQAIKSYSWDFGDGSTSSDQNPDHIYSEPGYYKVTLTIENTLNHTDSISRIVKVRTNVFAPEHPEIYVDDDKIFVTYMIGNNLLLIESSNQGQTWSNAEIINDIIYSVNTGYKNSFILDSEKIIFSDFRTGDSDIYFYYTYSPTVDLEIIDVSLVSNRNFIKTNNYLSFSVRNIGDVETYKDLVLNVTYKCKDENRTPVTEYPYKIIERISPEGTEIVNMTRPFFKLDISEYIDKMVELIDIEDITIIIDPDNETNDPNQVNNVFVIDGPDLYEEIFPVLGKRPMLVQLIKFIKNIRDLLQ